MALFVLVIAVVVQVPAAVAQAQGAVASKTIVVTDWIIPYAGPKQLDANVGDTIEFRWGLGFHNANIHPTMDCSQDGSIEVGTNGNKSPASYTFTEEDATENNNGGPDDNGTDIYFACDVGQHCNNGQNLIVTLFSTGVAEEEEEEEEEPIDSGLVGAGGLSTSTCSRNLPTSTGMAATKCALPPDQICCYGVQLERATICTCTGNVNGRTYECIAGKADDCPDNQNPNIITAPPVGSLPTTSSPTLRPSQAAVVTDEDEDEVTVPPLPPSPVVVVEVEDCSSATCDPADNDSCSCRPGLSCRYRGSTTGYICSQVTRVGRNRLSGAAGVGGAAGRDRGSGSF